MRKIAFFFFLLVIGGAMSSCSRDTTSIKYNKSGLPILDDRHLVAYVAAREEVGEALLSSFCKPRGCTYEFIRLSTEELLRRVEEEAGNPKADIIIGGTVDAHQMMKQKNYLFLLRVSMRTVFQKLLKIKMVIGTVMK